MTSLMCFPVEKAKGVPAAKFAKLCSTNDAKGLQKALKKGLYTPRDLYAPMSTALTKGHLECLKLMVKAGVDVNMGFCDGVPPIRKAAQLGNVEAVKALIEGGAELDAHRENYSPLMDAALGGHLNCMKLLVEAGSKVNTSKAHGTVLMLPNIGKQSATIKYLLDKGADVNVARSDGVTPLMLSVCYVNSARLMLESGAHVNAKDNLGNTALFYAVKDYHIGSIQLLLSYGPEVDIRDVNDVTPLTRTVHHFCSGISTEAMAMAKVLIRYGCSVNFKGRVNTKEPNGQEYAIDIASRANAVPLVWMLWTAGSVRPTTEEIKLYTWNPHFDQKWRTKCKNENELECFIRDTISQPRSLAGMCRNTIRHLLKLDVENKIKSLTLSGDLKRYLNFPEFEDYDKMH